MDRTSAALLGAVVLLAACKVEQTPPDLIDRRDAALVERAEFEAELRSYIPAFAQALNQGNASTALAALAPAPEASVIGIDDSWTTGARHLRQTLRELTAAGRPQVRVREARTAYIAAENVAGIAASLDVTLPDRDPFVLRLSGVYVREEGIWRLVQAHLSRPAEQLIPPTEPAEAADSLVPG